jgi:hypothetical protein
MLLITSIRSTHHLKLIHARACGSLWSCCLKHTFVLFMPCYRPWKPMQLPYSHGSPQEAEDQAQETLQNCGEVQERPCLSVSAPTILGRLFAFSLQHKCS